MELLVLPGDGIGPEITEATVHVLRVVDERLQRHAALSDPSSRTRDMGYRLGTADFAAAVSGLVETAPLS